MKYHVNFDIDLKKNPYKGTYIAVEGIDGAGKTTQVEKIAEHFRSKGKSVIRIKEPKKEGLLGEIAQKVLKRKIKISPLALQYLFATDRALNQEETIIPALKRGDMVVSDRCLWSAVPYGIMDKMLGGKIKKYDYKEAEVLLAAHGILSTYHQFIIPDFTFYIDVSIKTAIKRISVKHKIKELYEKEEKLGEVIDGYRWLAKRFPKEIVRIDGEKAVSEVTRSIIREISKHKYSNFK